MPSAGANPRDGSEGQAVVAGPSGTRVPVTHPAAVPAPQSLGESTVELTIRAQGGDQAALEALCLRCLKSLSRYAAGRLPPTVRDMLDTQDVVLEAVQRGMGRLQEFESRHTGALLAYMRTILRNLIIDYVRVRNRQPAQVVLEDQPDAARSPLERVLDAEQIALYESALARLKPRDAALVTLKIEEQLGHDEIARELGYPSANTARVAARRAVLRLAHEMSRLSHATPQPGDAAQLRDAS